MKVAYSEPCETLKMEFFAKVVSSWEPLTIFAKSSISLVWQSSEHASEWDFEKVSNSKSLIFLNRKEAIPKCFYLRAVM